LLDGDDLGLDDIRNGFDMRKDMAEVTDAVNGTESAGGARGTGGAGGSRTSLRKEEPAGLATADPLSKDRPAGGSPKDEPPPFDADAT
ncbi:MAG: sec-independent translocase, partial [Streptomyces sp.]